LLSALPTQPAHGFPTAAPLPLPFAAEPPLLVASYGPDAFAPPLTDTEPCALTEAETDGAVCVSAKAHAGPARTATANTNPA
jgi:hypothetical protein